MADFSENKNSSRNENNTPAGDDNQKKNWKDTIPPLTEKKQKINLDASITNEEKQALYGNNMNAIPIKEINYKRERKDSKNENKDSQIPEFDLAEKIMAQQRKISAMKRKKSGLSEEQETKKEDNKNENISRPPVHTQVRAEEQNWIIAEIVKSDIERFCTGGVVN